MASELQQRAEKILDRFESVRRPIVFEFAGTPKAGKTTIIGQVQTFLKRCGFRVKVVVERASVCPIRDKKHSNFNVWTACTTLAQILENTQEPPGPEDPQILILDRGIFDSICWLTMMDRLSRIQTSDREKIESFLLLDDWRKRLTGVILMTAAAEVALQREAGLLPVEAQGSIMNQEVLSQILETTKRCVERLKDRFRIFQVDTSSNGPNSLKRTAEKVVDIVLNLMEEQLTEEILYLGKLQVSRFFSGRTTLSSSEASPLLQSFNDGEFRARAEVEADKNYVQALPVVVVRNKSGEVLCLRRKEKSEANALHQKLVIWAGGHVRVEDSSLGEPVLCAAQRELQEELRLSVEKEELKFLGAVYADTEGKTSQHVALVFEWRAETDDVAVTLSTAEFFERKGTSLSGKFVPLQQLTQEIKNREMTEPWSIEIVRSLLPDSGLKDFSLPF